MLDISPAGLQPALQNTQRKRINPKRSFNAAAPRRESTRGHFRSHLGNRRGILGRAASSTGATRPSPPPPTGSRTLISLRPSQLWPRCRPRCSPSTPRHSRATPTTWRSGAQTRACCSLPTAKPPCPRSSGPSSSTGEPGASRWPTSRSCGWPAGSESATCSSPTASRIPTPSSGWRSRTPPSCPGLIQWTRSR